MLRREADMKYMDTLGRHVYGVVRGILLLTYFTERWRSFDILLGLATACLLLLVFWCGCDDGT